MPSQVQAVLPAVCIRRNLHSAVQSLDGLRRGPEKLLASPLWLHKENQQKLKIRTLLGAVFILGCVRAPASRQLPEPATGLIPEKISGVLDRLAVPASR